MMKIRLLIFISSNKKHSEKNNGIIMMKTFESDFRPLKGDVIEDPGFDFRFHNGYEVVKVTINYALNECFVSLQPLVLEREEIKIESYIAKLKVNDWRVVSKEELENLEK